ncbi:hypothetical protein VTJ49DRAFT_2360 [Mycothermus thermophilus]|uniref:HMG box domain-containing protein n=1 Tax=Humicola insolens TaxID=85995 RepID=A0ABR3VRB6_HUMIN
MTKLLAQILGELGIPQYFDVFLEQGFDTWDTILDITESDLDALGVKLGHRRKLQRRIAHFRGSAPAVSLVSPTLASAEEVKQEAVKVESPKAETRDAPPVVAKRKYRRHPKPDENAPERPPSAYVLFSNKMREELKGQNLSFTDMAKLVGEHWQNLTAAEKEPYESQAQAIKERYLAELAEYRKTPEYRKYMAYLQEFRAKYPSPSHDKDTSKRVKVEPQTQRRVSPGATPTRASRSGSGTESLRGSEPPCSRQRVGSVVSTSDPQHTSAGHIAPVPAPDDSAMTPVVMDTERQPRDMSPTVAKEPKTCTGNFHHFPTSSKASPYRAEPVHLRSQADIDCQVPTEEVQGGHSVQSTVTGGRRSLPPAIGPTAASRLPTHRPLANPGLPSMGPCRSTRCWRPNRILHSPPRTLHHIHTKHTRTPITPIKGPQPQRIIRRRMGPQVAPRPTAITITTTPSPPGTPWTAITPITIITIITSTNTITANKGFVYRHRNSSTQPSAIIIISIIIITKYKH